MLNGLHPSSNHHQHHHNHHQQQHQSFASVTASAPRMPFGIHELLGLSSQISPAYPRNDQQTPTYHPTNYSNAFAAAAAPGASCTVQSNTTSFPCSFDAAQMARQHFIAAAAVASGNFDGMMGFRNHQGIDFGNGM